MASVGAEADQHSARDRRLQSQATVPQVDENKVSAVCETKRVVEGAHS